MKKKLLVMGILTVLIISGCTVNAVTFDDTRNNEKSVIATCYVKSSIWEDFVPYVPASDGSQVIQVDGDTKMFIEIMNENNVITTDSTGSNSVLSNSGGSGNGNGFNLVLKECYGCYPDGYKYGEICWGFVVINEGDDYTFADDTIIVLYRMYFNYGDERDFSTPLYQLTTSTDDGSPFVWEHGVGDCCCYTFMFDASKGKPESITGVYEIISEENPDINPDDNMITSYVPFAIKVDYKVVNLTRLRPVKDAKVSGPFKCFDLPGPGLLFYSSSIKYFSKSDKKGEGRVPVLTVEPFSEARNYKIDACKEDKKQSKITIPVKEGDEIHLNFVLDVPYVKSKYRLNPFVNFLSKLVERIPILKTIMERIN